MPGLELRPEIDLVLELAVLEEGALYPAHEALHRALLIAAPGSAHLNTDANVDDRLREDLIELLDVPPLAALLHDRLRTIEYSHERQAAERNEVTSNATQDRLDSLVFNEGDAREPRVLQTGREEVHALLPTVDEPYVNVPEVVLRKLAGEPFESHHGRRARRPEPRDQRVERGLLSRVLGLLRPTQ